MLLGKTVGYNNINPRAQRPKAVTQLEDKEKETARLLERLDACHQNSIEAFAFYAVAALAAVVTKVDATLASQISTAFIAARIAYIYVFFSGTSVRMSLIRSTVWAIGIICTFGLLVVSALAHQRASQ